MNIQSNTVKGAVTIMGIACAVILAQQGYAFGQWLVHILKR